MTPVERELQLLREQSLVYAKELRSVSHKGRITERQLARYASEIRRMHQIDRAPVVLRNRLRERLNEIIDQRSWSVALQPIVDLWSGEAVGYESLARFSPDLGASPDRVFRQADDVGLGFVLELAVVTSALELLHEDPNSHYLSINLSPAAILSELFLPALDDRDSSRIVIEITEHAPVEDYDSLHSCLKEFRAAGGRIAVDDAGAGFASLQHIVRLAPDIMKLDISLTQGVDDSRAKHALANALVVFAREMDIAIIAEGIETQAQLSALRDLGVTFGQGYLLGRPETVVTESTQRSHRDASVLTVARAT